MHIKVEKNYFEDSLTINEVKRIKRHKNIAEFLRYILDQYSELLAIKNSSREVLFRELIEEVCVFAGALKSLKVKRGCNVGVFLDNNYEFAKSVLGVMSYGAVAVLLPMHLNGKAVGDLCKKFDISTLIYEPKLQAVLQDECFDQSGICTISTDEIARKCCKRGEICYELDTNSPACIVMTSGTSGESKGVVLSHRALLTGVHHGHYAKNGVFYQTYISLLPLTHIFGFIRTLLVGLATGSTVFFPDNLKSAFKDFAAIKPTVVVAVPSIAEIMLGLLKQFGTDFLGGKLGSVIVGGAAAQPSLVSEFKKFDIDVFLGYGLTESSSFVCGNTKNLKYPQSVGQPFPFQELKVVEGELWLKGDTLMSGYYGDTKEDSAVYHDGWFRTGDLVRIEQDNMMYIQGRIKDLIVLSNGENVSPVKIESLINALPFVKDSLVFEDSSSMGGSILCAEVLLCQNALKELSLEDNDIQAFVESSIHKINQGLFSYEKISKVLIRSTDFERNSSHKIIRPKSQTRSKA